MYCGLTLLTIDSLRRYRAEVFWILCVGVVVAVRDGLHTQSPFTLADNTVALAANNGLLAAAIRHFRTRSRNLTRCIGALISLRGHT